MSGDLSKISVLGLETFDEDVFFDKVETITVEGQHELLFTMKDGSEVRQHWEHTAQKESWTPERRALHAANRTKNPAKVPGVSYMTGKVRCELCGLNYNKQKRKVSGAGEVTFWKCRGTLYGGDCRAVKAFGVRPRQPNKLAAKADFFEEFLNKW